MQADVSVELGRDGPALELPWTSEDPSVRYYDLKNCPELVLRIPEAVAYPELSAFLVRINAPGFPLATAKCDAWYSREIAPEEEIFGADRKFGSYVDLVFGDKTACCSFTKHEEFARELCRLLSHAPDIAATVEVVIRRCYYHRASFVSQDPAGERVNPLRAAETNPQTTPAAPENYDPQTQENAESQTPGNSEPQTQENSEPPGQKNSGPPGQQNSESSGSDRTDTSGQPRLRGGPLEPADSSEQQRRDEERERDCPRDSISGFCFTAYVTGFGDGDHEPRRRWEIALTLLQHALVQLART